MANILFKGALQPLIYVAVINGLTLLAPPLFFLASIFAFNLYTLTINLDITLLTLYFLVACTLYNAFIMVVVSTGTIKHGEDKLHYFSVIIPAHNEESVIEETLKHVFEIDYPP
jgi:cellulose synthase/poly-beta-1,6-N-acetylglucosamine synthase-like glycosyltransferase